MGKANLAGEVCPQGCLVLALMHLYSEAPMHARSKTNSKLKQITLGRGGAVDCTAVEEVSEIICCSQPFISSSTYGGITTVVDVTISATVTIDKKPGDELYPFISMNYIHVLAVSCRF